MHDMGEIRGEARPGQPFDVLENERPRPCLTHDPDCFRPHVARIGMGSVFSAKGERLTRRAARYEIDLSLMPSKIDRPDIALRRQRPMTNATHLSLAIFPNRIAAPAIPFHHLRGSETCLADPHSKAACAGE